MAVSGKSKARRLSLAIAGSLAINGLILTGLAWRAQQARTYAEVTVDVFLPPLDLKPSPRLPPPPPEPEPPPPPPEPPRAPAAGAPVAAPRALATAPPAGTPAGPQVAADAGVEAAEVPLKLGCLGQRTDRRDRGRGSCVDAVTTAAAAKANQLGPPPPDQQNYAVLEPPGPPKGPPLEPGWHWVGPALIYVYGPEDKHFLPGQGSSVKHLFKPDEIYAVPKPR